MKLYSFFNSSTSYRVRIALAIKQLNYQYIPVNLRKLEQYSPNYQVINPSSGVPLLVDDDISLTQSLAIIDYLDTKYPTPRLIPFDSIERARVLELSNSISCDIHPLNNLRTLRYIQDELGADENAKAQWYRHWIQEGLAVVEELLSKHRHGSYCFGNMPTLADCCLIPQVANAQRMGCDVSTYSKVMQVFEYCNAQPPFQLAAPAQQLDYVE